MLGPHCFYPSKPSGLLHSVCSFFALFPFYILPVLSMNVIVHPCDVCICAPPLPDWTDWSSGEGVACDAGHTRTGGCGVH